MIECKDHVHQINKSHNHGDHDHNHDHNNELSVEYKFTKNLGIGELGNFSG